MNPDAGVFTPYTLLSSMRVIPRWNGHARLSVHREHNRDIIHDILNPGELWCLLQHTLLVYELIKKHHQQHPKLDILLLSAILHDGVEIVIGDIVGPFKRLNAESIKPYEKQYEKLLAERYGCPYPWAPEIKQADLIAQDIEGYYGFVNHVEGVNVRTLEKPSEAYQQIFENAKRYLLLQEILDLLTKSDKGVLS